MTFFKNITICNNDNGCANVFNAYYCKQCGKYQKNLCPSCHKVMHKEIARMRKELQ